MEKKYPKVGIGVIIVKDGKVLVGRRREEYGRGSWSFPGGKLEFSETFEDCAKRETKEEAGVEINNIEFICAINDFLSDLNKHYVNIYLKADYLSGVPSPLDGEYDKWEWRDWDDLPSPRFSP